MTDKVLYHADGPIVTVTLNDPANFVPPLESRWNWGGRQPAAIVTEFCEPAVAGVGR